MKDSLGDRMKANYEDAYRITLPRRMPCIIRCDGKAFHTLTGKMNKPWDDGLVESMINTTMYLCENVQNCVLGYVQSDEISLLLVDYNRLTTEAWFDKNLQKMVSISASTATLAFNKEIKKYYPEKEGIFDSRVFVMPKEEVCNYFLWRQQDASRNSVQMLGRAHFSHNALNDLSCPKIQDKLMLEKGINWNDTETHKKRGACVRKVEPVNKGDARWVVDKEIPIFSQDRDYINDLLIPEQE